MNLKQEEDLLSIPFALSSTAVDSLWAQSRFGAVHRRGWFIGIGNCLRFPLGFTHVARHSSQTPKHCRPRTHSYHPQCGPLGPHVGEEEGVGAHRQYVSGPRDKQLDAKAPPFGQPLEEAGQISNLE